MRNGTLYDSIRLKDAGHQETIGDPDLPVCHYVFYVPMNEKAIGVTFKTNKQETILLDNDLLPLQRPIPISLEKKDTTFNIPNKTIYESDNMYPAVQARISHTDYLDGDLKLVTVEVYPMLYYPKSKQIIYSSQFEFELKTAEDDNSGNNQIHPKKRDKEIINMLKAMVENPQTIFLDSSSIMKNAFLKVTAKEAGAKSWAIPFYEYVIVTSNALKASFVDLMTWKRQKGYNAGIVTIEDILADSMSTGDAVSNLNDNAGKLRQYLSSGYSAGITKYALLGGDYTVLPIRYGCAGDNSWDNGQQQIPSDLYFSDFNGNWNLDGDIYTGEEDDDLVDYASEIYVGRLLCTNPTDVATWTKKQLKYEQNPGNGNFGYLNRALFTESDQMQRDRQAKTISDLLPKNIQATILEETPSFNTDSIDGPKGAIIISTINANLYGLLSIFNHGSPTQYACATSGLCVAIKNQHCYYGVGADDTFDEELGSPYYMEAGNGFTNLTNYDYPAVCYSISCTNMPFDGFKTPAGSQNLGEAFTLSKGGGIAYLGNTRSGLIDTSYLLYKEFVNRLLTTNNLGKAEALSKSDYKLQSHHWLALTHNLIGCPETPMWTAIPTLFSAATVSLSGTTLIVNSGVVGSKICVTSDADGGQSYYQVIENVSNNTFTNVPASFKVVITKSNYIPFIYSSDCYIQNETFLGISTINASCIWAGNNVTTSKSSGPVVIQSGANVILNADGETILSNGFEVQTGAQFEVK